MGKPEEKYRQPPLESAKELESQLHTACDEMDASPRGAAITALQATIKFINTMPRLEYQNLTFVLTHLMAQLHDLDSGRIGPMVKPKKVHHRSPDATARLQVKAISAFAVGKLVDAGMQVEAACKFVAKQLAAANVEIGWRSTPAWKSVRNWRSEANRAPPRGALRSLLDELGRCDVSPATLAELKARFEKLLPNQFGRYRPNLE